MKLARKIYIEGKEIFDGKEYIRVFYSLFKGAVGKLMTIEELIGEIRDEDVLLRYTETPLSIYPIKVAEIKDL